MTGQQLHITDAGRAALVADDHRGTTARRVTEIGLGVSNFDFDPAMSSLPGEHKRISTFGGEVVAADTIHVVIQDDTGDAYSLRAFGLYLDDGVLFGVYVQADPIMEKTAAAILLLAADVQLTSVDASVLQFGPVSFLNPPATTEIQGVVELATQAEVDAGKDASRVVTPAALKVRLDVKADLSGADFTGPIQVIPRASNGYAISAFRNFSDLTQTIKIGAAPGLASNKLDNWVASYSSPVNAKWLVLGATTDAANTVATGGSVGISFRVYDAVKASITQSGRFIIGYRTYDTGNALLQVDGAAYVQGAILRGNTAGIFNGSTDVAGIQNFGTSSDASINNARFSADNVGATLNVGKSRGAAVGAMGAVQADDELARINFTGSDGIRLVSGAAFVASATNAFTAVSRPTRIDVQTVPSGAIAPLTRMRVTETGRVLIGKTTDDGPGLLQVAGYASAQTPPPTDVSTMLATTEWIVQHTASQTIGTIIIETRTSVRAGCLKLNGALLMRSDYPALWSYAMHCGAMVSDANWQDHNWGNFSEGDGATTFRLPDMRGEFIRGWDDGRGVDGGRIQGSWQDSLNRSHGHGAWASQAPDHVHTAWTDAQGSHAHSGQTDYVGEHQHVSPFGENSGAYQPPWGTWGANNNVGTRSGLDYDNVFGLTSWAGGHTHQFWTNTIGAHAHAVGIGSAGNHTHDITVNTDGGNEARPRNVALLVMIRAY